MVDLRPLLDSETMRTTLAGALADVAEAFRLLQLAGESNWSPADLLELIAQYSHLLSECHPEGPPGGVQDPPETSPERGIHYAKFA